jgi:hypothetical protein
MLVRSCPGEEVTTMSTAPWPDHLTTLTERDALDADPARRFELVGGVLLVVPRRRDPLRRHPGALELLTPRPLRVDVSRLTSRR